ncbi:hypothetical protein [Edaphobacter modestus]|uniref:Uncharacterized protein n=1 Tax=Edaphobacter modestus TaxID=388466 RepID=A0A4Q7YYY0_9BACT|nr:hypothetical protein [Edaphobacter modestus]RZU42413.1 hypothetical protein BDD14_3993 [Edaphobacter modestus]
MSGLWCWLGNNSSQLQALGSIGAVFVAVALGFVAIRQARAADAQANAARAQVDAANRQTESSIIVADKQTSPHISITAASNREGVLLKDTFTILNNGQGRARSLQLRYRDQSVGFELPLGNSVLVVRDSLSVRFDGGRGALSGFRLTYSTDFGAEYALEFQWNGIISRIVNE